MELGAAIAKGNGVVTPADLRQLEGARVQQGHYVVVGEEMWIPQRVANEGTLSGRPQEPLEGGIELVIGRRARRGPKRRAAEREKSKRRRRALDGLEPDPQGWWRIAEVLDVKRPIPRRGQQLSALVRWEGRDADTGEPWEDSWQPVAQGWMSQDQISKARAMEAAKYGVSGAKRGPSTDDGGARARDPGTAAVASGWRAGKLRARDASGRTR